VRTPPTLTYAEAGLGNPCVSTAASVEVPPMSRTIASFSLERSLAPRREFVGPDENVKTGNCTARSAVIMVPSF